MLCVVLNDIANVCHVLWWEVDNQCKTKNVLSRFLYEFLSCIVNEWMLYDVFDSCSCFKFFVVWRTVTNAGCFIATWNHRIFSLTRSGNWSLPISVCFELHFKYKLKAFIDWYVSSLVFSFPGVRDSWPFSFPDSRELKRHHSREKRERVKDNNYSLNETPDSDYIAFKRQLLVS